MTSFLLMYRGTGIVLGRVTAIGAPIPQTHCLFRPKTARCLCRDCLMSKLDMQAKPDTTINNWENALWSNPAQAQSRCWSLV
jgi:hypothetical protein